MRIYLTIVGIATQTPSIHYSRYQSLKNLTGQLVANEQSRQWCQLPSAIRRMRDNSSPATYRKPRWTAALLAVAAAAAV